MPIKYAETRECPPEYQERLTRLFGINQFGDPNFKIMWNQSIFIRLGNVWRDAAGNERVGYKDVYQGDGQPCWVILRWKPPSDYGSPTTYYRNTFDSLTKLYFVGEYPWRGRYEILQPLIKKEFVGGKLEVSHMPLSHYLIDVVIPMIMAFQNLSIEEQQAARQLALVEEEKARTAEVAEKMIENMPTWVHPVSYGRQGCRTSVLDQKMHSIQKVWDRMSRGGRKPQFKRGLAQGDSPLAIR